ncbi:MAG: hypothetical protein ACLP01_26040 [Solirubrobacteraceae bacterium]
MPPLPDVPNVLSIELKLTVGDANVLSRVHVNYASAAPTRHILNEYAASIDSQIAAHLIPLCSTEVRTTEIVVTDLTSRTSARGIAESRQIGTRPGPQNGAGVAALINFKVARRYRGGKPRLYVPLFVASDLTPGLTWCDSALEAGTAGWAAFMAGLLTHTPATLRLLGQVNVSYYEGFRVVTDPLTGRSRNVSQRRPQGPAVDRITGFSINPKLGSQRRRNLHSRRPARIRR